MSWPVHNPEMAFEPEPARKPNGHDRPNGKGNGHAAIAPSVSDAVELDQEEFPTLEFIVKDLVASGLTILAGKPKIGKSWLALCIIESISRGAVALGSLETQESEVLYLALEDTKRRLQQRLRAVRQGEAPSPKFFFATEWKRLDQGGLDDLRRWLEMHPAARVVVVDTLAKVKAKQPRDTQLYDADYAAIAPLKALADERKVAIIAVTHLRKASADDPLDEITGSIGITGAADTLMVLKRQKSSADATLYLRGRDIEERDDALQFDGQTGRWDLLGDAAQHRQSQERVEIIREIMRRGEPLKPKDVAEALYKNRSTVRGLMVKMADQGLLTRDAQGRYAVAQP